MSISSKRLRYMARAAGFFAIALIFAFLGLTYLLALVHQWLTERLGLFNTDLLLGAIMLACAAIFAIAGIVARRSAKAEPGMIAQLAVQFMPLAVSIILGRLNSRLSRRNNKPDNNKST